MGKNLRKTPSRDGKRGKFFEKSFSAAGKGKNPPKNAFVRREGGKICWRSVSRGGKWGEISEKRFPPREEHFQEAAVPAAGSAPRLAHGFARANSLLLRPKSLTYYIRKE